MVGKLTPDTIISASRIPVLMGVSPYETPNELMRSILDARQGKPRQWLDQNEPMFWGDTLEPVILGEAAKRLNLTDVVLDFDAAIHHPSLPLAASLDGKGTGTQMVAHDPANDIYCPQGQPVDISGVGVLEAKNTSVIAEDAPAPHRGVLQLQAQMMCTGYEWGCVAVLYRGGELRLFMYQADLVVQGEIANAIREFERNIELGDWYPATTSADANAAWNNVDDGAPPLDLDDVPDADYWAGILIDAKAQKKALDQEIDIAETNLKEMLGNHEEGVVTNNGSRYYIKWPMRKTRAQPAKTVAAKPESIVRQKTLTVKEVPNG